MFKYLILGLMLLLAVPAVAEVGGIGPDYIQLSLDGPVVFNSNFLTTPAMMIEGYLYSDDGTFSVAGYRYNRNSGVYVKVFPTFSNAPASAAVAVPMQWSLPINMKLDKIEVSNITGTVHVLWYK